MRKKIEKSHGFRHVIICSARSCYILLAQYWALGKHLSQYLWITTASSNWNNASVVAIAEHVTQKPAAFFVLDNAGRVSNGFAINNKVITTAADYIPLTRSVWVMQALRIASKCRKYSYDKSDDETSADGGVD